MILNEECADLVESSGEPKKLLWLYVAPLSSLDLEGVTLPLSDSFSIQDIPWLTASNPWEFIEPDPESDSVYTETYADDNGVITQKAAIVVKGVKAVKMRAIQELQKHCALAVIVVYESQEAVIQGVDHLFVGFGLPLLIPTLEPATISNVVTTSASSTDSSKIALDIISVARQYAPTLSDYTLIVN